MASRALPSSETVRASRSASSALAEKVPAGIAPETPPVPTRRFSGQVDGYAARIHADSRRRRRYRRRRARRPAPCECRSCRPRRERWRGLQRAGCARRDRSSERSLRGGTLHRLASGEREGTSLRRRIRDTSHCPPAAGRRTTATLLRSSRKLISPRGLNGVTTISAAITPMPIGNTLASNETIRSCEPPGAAKRCRSLRSALASWVSMRS